MDMKFKITYHYVSKENPELSMPTRNPCKSKCLIFKINEDNFTKGTKTIFVHHSKLVMNIYLIYLIQVLLPYHKFEQTARMASFSHCFLSEVLELYSCETRSLFEMVHTRLKYFPWN